jgi:hypothetical protein
MDAQTNPIPNTRTLDALKADMVTLGEEAGKGKDTQVKAGLKILEGAYFGTIDLSANKHGTDKTDAVVLAETYVRAQGSAVIFDAKAPNQRKLVSTFNTLIKFGGNPKWGSGEPLANVNALMTLRQKLRAAGGVKLDDAFNSLLKYARAQMKEDTMITGQALEQFLRKKETDVRSVKDVLDGVRNTIIKLRKGQLSNVAGDDQSAETQQILSHLNKRIAALAGQ